MKTAAPVIQFQLSQVVDGLTVSVGVEAAAEALAGALPFAGCPLESSCIPSECRDSARRALQGEVLQALNELSVRLSLSLLRTAQSMAATELADEGS